MPDLAFTKNMVTVFINIIKKEIEKMLTQKRTRIVAAFPGTGKSYYHNEHPDTTLDSDSSNFSWIMRDGEKIRNPDFPHNYIQHIKDNIGKYDFIFVSSHSEVRNALKDNCIFFYLVYPEYNCKDMYLLRYEQRGNTPEFIKLIDENWECWLRQCDSETYGCKQVSLSSNWNIEDMVSHTICSENGDM